ncbi:hypothetical protein POF51_22565 [Brevibacillus sp. AG]|uniref:hypothetical protein n=1 Tax=Brevibacillus sp. AG TaxID=3020891 RepID=UPI00232F47D7|nr:hypothetical protein [Brevibacillus sp. AG]MDC0763513.1 hypothetical protein [Brevibacillus sp. AG]
MSTQKTKVIMDSGKEYTIDKHPEDFLERITDKDGILLNGFVHFLGVSINPSHISSIETIEVKEKRVQDKPQYL